MVVEAQATTEDAKKLFADIRSQIDEWNSKHANATSGTSPVSSAVAPSPQPSPQVVRTGCSPAFSETDRPIDITQRYEFPSESIIPITQLEADHQFQWLQSVFGYMLVITFFQNVAQQLLPMSYNSSTSSWLYD